MEYKAICIKHYENVWLECVNEGDIVNVSPIFGGSIADHHLINNEIWIHKDIISNYFISLSEYRNKKINEILE